MLLVIESCRPSRAGSLLRHDAQRNC